MQRVLLASALMLVLAAPVPASAQSSFGLNPNGPTFVPPDGFPLDPTEPGADAEDLDGPSSGKGDLPALQQQGGTTVERRAHRLDRMFDELAGADTKQRADRISRHILRRLGQSGSDTVDLLMSRAEVAMGKEDYGLALDLLDGVVRTRPDFAEGWNRRATANFVAGNFGQSIADIEQTLRREPRHWGAILGLSMILVSLERKDDALVMMDRALAINPFLDELKDRRDRLRRELDVQL